MSAVTAVQDAIGEVVGAVGPSVVGLGRGWGVGSGVVIAENQVLTSAHNLRRDEATVTFADGRRETAKVAGVDADLDLAVLTVETGEAPAVAWEPAGGGAEAAAGGAGAAGGGAAAAAGPLPIGTAVVALADPGGRGLRATLGFVASSGRTFRGPRGRRVRGAIEHTAPLPRGSSGGPLVDLEGRLLGINSLRLEGGLILAVPASAAVRERVTALARGEAPEQRRLGVAIAPPRAARRMRRAVGLPERDGLLVRAVEDGSPADAAGIERGDLIVSAGGKEIDGVDSLYAILDALPGQLALTVVRGTEEREVEVTFE